MTRRGSLTLATRAGILCNDRQFRRYVGQAIAAPGGEVGTEAAAEYLRRFCGVTSRRDLDMTPEARARFDTLTLEFDAWRGRIARHR